MLPFKGQLGTRGAATFVPEWLVIRMLSRWVACIRGPFGNGKWSFLVPYWLIIRGLCGAWLPWVQRTGAGKQLHCTSLGRGHSSLRSSSRRQGEPAGLKVFLLVRCAACCLRCFCMLLDFELSANIDFNAVEKCGWYKCMWPSGALQNVMSVQTHSCLESLSLLVVSGGVVEKACLWCEQVNDLLSLVAELRDEIERLRSIRES